MLRGAVSDSKCLWLLEYLNRLVKAYEHVIDRFSLSTRFPSTFWCGFWVESVRCGRFQGSISVQTRCSTQEPGFSLLVTRLNRP